MLLQGAEAGSEPSRDRDNPAWIIHRVTAEKRWVVESARSHCRQQRLEVAEIVRCEPLLARKCEVQCDVPALPIFLVRQENVFEG
jgi:hypothetical protein